MSTINLSQESIKSLTEEAALIAGAESAVLDNRLQAKTLELGSTAWFQALKEQIGLVAKDFDAGDRVFANYPALQAMLETTHNTQEVTTANTIVQSMTTVSDYSVNRKSPSIQDYTTALSFLNEQRSTEI